MFKDKIVSKGYIWCLEVMPLLNGAYLFKYEPKIIAKENNGGKMEQYSKGFFFADTVESGFSELERRLE